MSALRHMLSGILLLAALPLQAATYTVNHAGSGGDSNTADGTCSTATPANGSTCTLHAAIQQANAVAGTHTIKFAASITKITLSASLPMITSRLTLDGSNAAAVAAGGRVEIDGAGVAGCIDLRDVTTATHPQGATGSTVKNLVIRRCSGDGIGVSGHGYTITGNRIGTNPGATSASSASDQNSGEGIFLTGSVTPPNPPSLASLLSTLPDGFAGVSALQESLKAALTIIANPTVISGNVVSGNSSSGIWLSGQGTVNTIVAGNIIGLSQDGLSAIPNGRGPGSTSDRAGLRISGTAWGNFIGPGNIISGNLGDGIALDPGQVLLPNFIAGNLIGLGSAPTDVGNAESGISIDTRPKTSGPGFNNPTGIAALIGPGNTISDNRGAASSSDLDLQGDSAAGIVITGNSDQVRIFGNVIGLATFPAGATPLGQLDFGNAGNGILIGAPNTEVRNNLILANGRHGIVLRSSGTTNTLVRGNFIGVSPPTGLDPFIGLGNVGDGIHISGASSSIIGGPSPSDANVIAGNRRNGIALRNGALNNGWANLIQRNRIFGNGRSGTGIGIDLERVLNGADPLDQLENPGTNYANYDQHRPAICGAAGAPPTCDAAEGPTSGGASASLSWTVVNRPNSSMRIEFFAQPADGSDQTYLGERIVQTDAAGLPTGAGCEDGVCTATVGSGDLTGMRVVATSTDLFPTDVPPSGNQPVPTPLSAANNTSEFSTPAEIRRRLEITTPSPLPGGTTNVNYTLGFAAIGGSGQYVQWSVVAGSLPVGLSLNPTSGALSGVPTAAGTSEFSVRVQDSAGAEAVSAYSLAVAMQPPLLITTASPLPSATVASSYAQTFNASGGNGAKSGWAVFTGSLPDGLGIDAASGQLSGTPSAAGSYEFSVRVNDETPTVAIKPFVLNVLPAAVPLAITTASPLPTVNEAQSTSIAFAASGGSGSYVAWAVTAGTLPNGLVLDPGAGVLSGTATTAGSFAFTLRVTDSAGATASKAFSLSVSPAPIPPMEPTFFAVPSEIDFGEVNVGRSGVVNVTLTNLGSASVGTRILAASVPEFQVDPGTCGTSLAPGGSCSMIVVFTPGAGGGTEYTGSSVICRGVVFNGICLPVVIGQPHITARLQFRGVGSGTLAEVAPRSIDFGERVVGSSATVDVGITNHTDALLTYNPQLVLSNPGAFSVQSQSCGLGLVGTNNTCTIRFRFAPTIPGLVESSTRITVVGAAGSEPYDIFLRGTGVATAPPTSTTPMALDFGEVQVGRQRTLSLSTRNDSGNAILLSGSSLASDSPTWSSNIDALTFPVANAASFTSTYTFTPPEAGSYVLSPQLDATGPGLAQSIPLSLSGSGVGRMVQAGPTSIPLGLVPLGDGAFGRVQISNQSDTSVTRSFGTAPPFVLSTSCGASIPAGGACYVQYALGSAQEPVGSLVREATLRFDNPTLGISETVRVTISATVVGQVFRDGFE